MQYIVRMLGKDDATAFRRVRLEALRLHPEAYTASYEDEAQLNLAQFTERLATPGRGHASVPSPARRWSGSCS